MNRVATKNQTSINFANARDRLGSKQTFATRTGGGRGDIARIITARHGGRVDLCANHIGQDLQTLAPFAQHLCRTAIRHPERVRTRVAADDVAARVLISNLCGREKGFSVDVISRHKEVPAPAVCFEHVRDVRLRARPAIVKR